MAVGNRLHSLSHYNNNDQNQHPNLLDQMGAFKTFEVMEMNGQQQQTPQSRSKENRLFAFREKIKPINMIQSEAFN